MGEVFNVGSTEEVTILELARKVFALVHKADGFQMTESDSVVFAAYKEAYAGGFEDMHQRVSDISKTPHYSGWEPRHSLVEILQDVVASLGEAKT